MFFSPIGNSNPFLPNLVAYYKFDTNSNDFSGNSHNGVDTAISYANAGKVGNCATFNGSTIILIRENTLTSKALILILAMLLATFLLAY